MYTVLQTVLDAITLGSLYSLMALGVALIFGVMRLVNFAHGEFIMAGGYVLFFFAPQPLPIAIAGAFVSVLILALVTERVAFRPVRSAQPSTLLVTSFAVSYLLQNVAILTVGALAKTVTIAEILTESIFLVGFRFPIMNLFTILLTAGLVIGLGAFFKRTNLGIQMRAAAQDFRMARLLGVRANAVIAAAFGISAVLAVSVSVLLVGQTGSLTPRMGLFPVIIAFIATIIGGLGSLPGAALGGFLFGSVTTLFQVSLPVLLSPYRDAFAFAVVILMLIFRPQGLLGTS